MLSEGQIFVQHLAESATVKMFKEPPVPLLKANDFLRFTGQLIVPAMSCQFWSDMQVLLPAQWDHMCAPQKRELQVPSALCRCVG